MTEAEWNNSNDSGPMLDWLGSSGSLETSDRKLRLFGCACLRRVWDLLSDERFRQIVAVAEQFAEDPRSRKQLATAAAEAMAPAGQDSRAVAAMMYSLAAPDAASVAWWAGIEAAAAAAALAEDNFSAVAHQAAEAVAVLSGLVDWGKRSAAWRDERAAQANLLRDVFGPLPFRTPALSASLSSWKDGAILTTACRIYETREFALMPELGAALQEAGCQDAEVLGHVQCQGPHARGCWALDLILARS